MRQCWIHRFCTLTGRRRQLCTWHCSYENGKTVRDLTPRLLFADTVRDLTPKLSYSIIIFLLPANQAIFYQKTLCNFVSHMVCQGLSSLQFENEPRYEKTGFLHMRKQRRRSAPR